MKNFTSGQWYNSSFQRENFNVNQNMEIEKIFQGFKFLKILYFSI